jgi:radical SAM protein with 4Fe4S-binding SPASM domain
MDMNNKCNLRCRMCYFSLDLRNEPYSVMNQKLFEKIASDVFPRTVQVNLSCAAEPFLLKEFPDYLTIAKKYPVPTTVVVTNAYLMDERISKSLIDFELTYVDVSIDGATKSTYESIRKGSDFDRVIGNVKALQEMKRSYGAKSPMLYLDYALMRSTIDEFPDFIRLAKSLGADHVRANHLIPFKKLGVMKESLINFRKEANESFAGARSVARELGVNVTMPPDFELSKEPNAEAIFNKPGCRVPFESIFIVSDGRAIPCTWFPLKKMCAGDFKNQTFDEIWNGKIYTDLRRRFDGKEFTEYCLNCPVYGDEAVNSYVFRERPREDVVDISSLEV